MSDYFDYDDYERYEPTEIEGLEHAIKAEASAIIDADAIRVLIEQYIKKNFQGVLKQYIQQEVIKCLKSAYESKARFKEVLYKVIEDKFDQKYPGAVDDKIDELEEEIKNFEFKWGSTRSTHGIQEQAEQRIQEYIDNELIGQVKKQTEWLEQYSRNYFAHNLFRAMGMFDKMLPVADPEKQTPLDMNDKGG